MTGGVRSPARRFGAGLVIVCGLVIFASPAHARDRIVYAGVRAGYLQVEDVDAGSLNVGLLGGVYFAPRVALEGSLDYHTPDFDTYGRTTYAFQASVSLYPFTAKRAFRPYGVAGVGFYWNYYEPEEGSLFPEDNVTDGGFHAGFGFDVILGDLDAWTKAGFEERPLCLTVDFRYLFTQDDPEGTRSDGVLATIGFKVGF